MSNPSELDSVFRVVLPRLPYPGLRPFEKEEWPIFFGRERITDEVAKRLIAKRLLIIHGDSGCGKSSLIRAGVLTRLEQESARSGTKWRTCTAIPGAAPVWSIAEALADLSGEPNEQHALEFRRALNFGRDAPAALANLLHCWHPNEHICLLIDQFEEVFEHARRHGPHEAQLVVDFLDGLHEAGTEWFCAIVTMRSEFLGACARYRNFANVVNETQYLLPHMGHSDLVRAIREPATLFGGEVSYEFAERLIIDAGDGQDKLPLIQQGLMLLCEAGRSSGNESVYWRLGGDKYHSRGVVGLISDHANAVQQAAQRAWPPSSGEGPDNLVEGIFRALTDVTADGQAIRRPQTLAQLAASTGTDIGRVRNVVDMFRAKEICYLKPQGRRAIGPSELVDISHEALIRCWDKIAEPLDGWLARETRDGLTWRALLVQANSFHHNPRSLLSSTAAGEREVWLRGRNAAWAERYGGGWDRVQRLVKESVAAADT